MHELASKTQMRDDASSNCSSRFPLNAYMFAVDTLKCLVFLFCIFYNLIILARLFDFVL